MWLTSFTHNLGYNYYKSLTQYEYKVCILYAISKSVIVFKILKPIHKFHKYAISKGYSLTQQY